MSREVDARGEASSHAYGMQFRRAFRKRSMPQNRRAGSSPALRLLNQLGDYLRTELIKCLCQVRCDGICRAAFDLMAFEHVNDLAILEKPDLR